MKELTMEEKAKRYDEAIERAKGLYAKGAPDSLHLEEMFPELKENKESNEDEQIRKRLIQALHGDVLNFAETVKAVAWLEKQGEKTSDKIVEKARTEKQRVLLTETDGSANIDWDCRSLDDVKILLKCGLEFIRTIEADKQILTDNRFGGCSFRVPTRYDKGIKQGEQKPVFEMKTPEESLGIESDTYSKIVDECIYGEPNPAWSEEDKDFMYDTLSNLTELKDRYGEGYGNVGKCIDWLKSLKERYSWKPSDEQIDVLLSEVSAWTKGCPKQIVLESLYNDLLKLKE